MKQDQMWIVQFHKKEYLDVRHVLVTTERLTEVIATFTQLYDDWKDVDSILIKPTEITYCG